MSVVLLIICSFLLFGTKPDAVNTRTKMNIYSEKPCLDYQKADSMVEALFTQIVKEHNLDSNFVQQ
ncbi:hypothetical protein [Niabella drilacis]|nr:hypothetical protein [Niabella drilacis]